MPATGASHYQCVNGGNDSNGNSRRIWLYYAPDGNLIHIEDEHNYGPPQPIIGLTGLPSFDITGKEYQYLQRRAKLCAAKIVTNSSQPAAPSTQARAAKNIHISATSMEPAITPQS